MATPEGFSIQLPQGAEIEFRMPLANGGVRTMIVTLGSSTLMKYQPVIKEGRRWEHPNFWYAEPDTVTAYDFSLEGSAARVSIADEDNYISD